MQWLVSAERLAAGSLRQPLAMGKIYIGTELGTAAASALQNAAKLGHN